jgi:PmbA protein
MLGEEKIREIARIALATSKADQTEAVVMTSDSSLTRFANNSIHQNVSETNGILRIRVVLGKRVGVAESNDLSPDGIRRTVDTARAIAQLQPENPDFGGLPPPQPVRQADAYVTATANCSPEARALLVRAICQQANANKLIAAGAFKTETYELAVANSLGTFAHHPGTIADLHAVMMGDSASGYASAASPDVRELHAEPLAREAIDKALRSRNPIALQPGEYTVFLEESAVSDLLEFLGWLAFNALAVQEDRSFMKDHFGEKLMSDAVTIGDDGLATDTFAMPFDYEGVPKQRITFIENGVARAVVYDSFTAGREGKQSTGHSLPAPNTAGPVPLHMFLSPGATTKEEMIRSVTRGVLVTRFWYTRVVHPLHVTMTGMTRDGTFLIEHGQVTQPIKNMRFTTSYLDAMKNARQIGRDTKLVREDWMGRAFRVPAILVDGFNFTGVTQ